KDRKGIVPDLDLDRQTEEERIKEQGENDKRLARFTGSASFELDLGQMYKTHDFVLEYVDTDGIDGRRRIKIDVTDDAAPKVETLDLLHQLRTPRDKAGQRMPIRILGRTTSDIYLVTPDALVPWKGRVSDDIGLTGVKWEYSVQQVHVELTQPKEKDK